VFSRSLWIFIEIFVDQYVALFTPNILKRVEASESVLIAVPIVAIHKNVQASCRI